MTSPDVPCNALDNRSAPQLVPVGKMAFDPFNLLLLAIALVVFWRLKSVLGTRTGNERPPFDPFGTERKGQDGSDKSEAETKILRFPQQDEEAAPAKAGDENEAKPPVWTGYAEAGSPIATGLERLVSADQSFDPKSFIEGAKMAYEMVIDAFARGDKPTLKTLLARDVLDGFAKAIDSREALGQRMESRFVGIDSATIHGVTLNGSKARITVEFISELISATLSKSGEVIDGDPNQIREITDVWTFERDTKSRNPNWLLVATQAPD